jgi:S-adenosylmethionine/arginine decarboxylase-like enzyme
MILDIKNIKNQNLLGDLEKMKTVLDDICKTHDFTVLQKVGHPFEPIGYTLFYLLSEYHISVHTFPECNYIAFDIYTCRDYTSNVVYEYMHRDLVKLLDADEDTPLILDRKFE